MSALRPTSDPSWFLEEQGFNLAREHEIESLFTVANGYIGTRGSLAEGSSLSSPATFIAGIYDIDPDWSLPELAVAPDWMRVRGRINGHDLRLEGSQTFLHKRVLDMRQGILWREWRPEDPEGRVGEIRALRLASLADRHLLVQRVWFTSENFSGNLVLETHIQPAPNLPGRMELLYERKVERPETFARLLPLRTANTGVSVIFVAASRIFLPDGRVIEPQRGPHEDVELWNIDLRVGETLRLDRLVLVYSSRDTDSPASLAMQHMRAALDRGADALIADHTAAWAARWMDSDIRIEGDGTAQKALRFACYHLIAAANPDEERTSVGARALSGAAYKGHVFWDTEIFMLPFYVFTHPATARALLMYRYHTLPAAREKARRLGYAGALYPWESADTGAEVTPSYALLPNGEVIPILNGEQEQHINADVAYGVWQYWLATGDEDFLANAGAEILIETARFWSSRATIDDDGLYHIRGVIGPDEYHMSVDDNAFTNGMAQWNLRTGAAAGDWLRERRPEAWTALIARIELGADEPDRWRAIADRIAMHIDSETGVIEQFAGYFALEDIYLPPYLKRQLPMEVVIGRERLPHTKVVKQADVLMLIVLLWDQFSADARRANFTYYEQRTAHGSSLSPAIHALMAARLGEAGLAERYFRQAAEIDLSNNMGNAAGGVHAAALGGLWQAAIFGFAGMILHPDGLAFRPELPPAWSALRFAVRWRAVSVRASVTRERFEVTTEGEGRIRIVAGETAKDLAAGEGAQWVRTPDGDWQEQK